MIIAFLRIATLLIGAAAFDGAQAQEPDPNDVASGMRLFRVKGNCQACHGWAADGRKMDSQMPDGANLRETQLDRKAITTLIQCGRPGSGMPAYDRLAYSDGRCYGMKAADLAKAGMTLTDPPATLAAREIELVVDFLSAKVVGKGPMNRARCIDYWGSEVNECKELPE